MYRKFISDRIFNGYDFLPGDSVLITRHSGEIVDCVPREQAGDDIQYLPGLLMPGMVNAHCHIELSHMKGKIPMQTGLVGFIQQVLSGRQAPDEEKQEAMKRSEEELFASGTVAVGDICNTPDSIPLKRNSRMYWHNFIEVTGFVPVTANSRFQAGSALAGQFRELLDPETVTLVPHAAYSVSADLFHLINRETDGSLISIHNQESREENRLFLEGQGQMRDLYRQLGIDIGFFKPTGTSSLRHWLSLLNRGQKIISVHNTFTSEDDTAFQLECRRAGGLSEMYYCLCIGANLYIENALPDVEMFLGKGRRMIIGTDSYASNTCLNTWEEIKRIRNCFPRIPENLVLQWATSEGAQALGIGNRLGSFEKGKEPGLVHVSGEVSRRIL